MPNEEYLNESLRKIAKGAGIVFIGTGIGMFFAYLGMMIVARFLGPINFGLISLASVVTTIASTVVLVGMPGGAVRYVRVCKIHSQ
jgi:O-antigen/teichoic acid export membrane protein